MRAALDIGWKVLVVVGAFCVFGAFFAFRSFSAQSASMAPTLHAGDYIAVSVTAYGISKYAFPGHPDLFRGRFFARDPERGDVVVFALPRDSNIAYIKRVIGLPGDTIQVKRGRLLINGTTVAREPIAKARVEDYYGRDAEVPTFRETLPGGRSYDIIEVQGDTGFNDNTEAFQVPASSFFVMGDNRDNSMDSRILPDQGGVGYVPFDNLIGRVDVVFLSLPKDGALTVPMRRVH